MIPATNLYNNIIQCRDFRLFLRCNILNKEENINILQAYIENSLDGVLNCNYSPSVHAFELKIRKSVIENKNIEDYYFLFNDIFNKFLSDNTIMKDIELEMRKEKYQFENTNIIYQLLKHPNNVLVLYL